MTNYEQSLVEGIEIIVKQAIKDTPYTSSHVGKVLKLKGLEATVEVNGVEISCYLLEHMSGQIGTGDVVVIQDLFNDGSSKYIFSKIGRAN